MAGTPTPKADAIRAMREAKAERIEAAKAKASSNPSVVSFTAPKSKGLPSISNVGAAGSVGGNTADISDDDMFDKWASR